MKQEKKESVYFSLIATRDSAPLVGGRTHVHRHMYWSREMWSGSSSWKKMSSSHGMPGVISNRAISCVCVRYRFPSCERPSGAGLDE